MDVKEKAKSFIKDIKFLSEKYGLSVFAVTEGASIYNNYNNYEAVRVARDSHIKWEENLRG
ncbi:MAG: hypothetical protein P1P64_03460 [Treponemataceae bacterium]